MNTFHLDVPPNRFGRDFIIGDLHGHLTVLQEALHAAHFVAGRDRLFSVGDLIDRGPDSPGAAALLANKWFFAVRGNHEDMLLSAVAGKDRTIIEAWHRNGGEWGIDGVSANAAARAAALLCARMPFAITLHHKNGKRFGICHAQCPVAAWGDIETVQHDADLRTEMLWARDRIRQRHAPQVGGIDWTIHGHSVVTEPLRSGNALFIETGCFRPGGKLTLLCLDEFA